jgi:dihydrofolate synthase/folylpolyglutamate synthase
MSSGANPLGSLAQATAWLEGLIDLERRSDWRYERLGLDPIRQLLARVGDPQTRLSAIHIAGSKGKGSTALLADAVLRALGERVGTFTSPHLESWTERFRIDGRAVEGGRLTATLERLRPHVEALRREHAARAPTFFDVTTAAALLLFGEERVDRAVVEVGLGGRLDSTNVIEPALACVTTIELEHTDRLGTTLEAIAREKVGIAKPGRPLVVGALPREAEAVVLERAEEIGAPTARLGRDFGVEIRAAGADGLALSLRDGELAVDAALRVLGPHQAANAALAFACVRRLAAHPAAELAAAAMRGFAAVELPGRVELLARAPWIVVDGAHTGASARALARALEPLERRRTELVLSVSVGKDLASILDALLPLADRVTVTRSEPARSLSPDGIAAAVRAAAPGLALRVVPNPQLALRAAREAVDRDSLLVATGSVYLAGLARRAWQRSASPAPSLTRATPSA